MRRRAKDEEIYEMDQDQDPEQEQENESVPRSRSTMKFIRYLLLLVMVMVALILLFTNREQISGDNFRRLMAKINLGLSSSTAEDGHLQFGDGETIVYKDGFAHAGTENLIITDRNGTEFQTAPLGYRKPCISANNRYILAYDADGTGLMVADSFSVLFDKQMEDDIITARMNDAGYLVVVTEGDGFLAKVYVFDSSFKEIYRYRSLNRYILDAAVTDDNKSIVLSAINVSDGNSVSELLCFRLNKEEIKWTVAYDSAPCVRLTVKENGVICGLFSWGMVALNTQGKELGRYSFDNRVLQCYSMEDESRNVFVLSATENGNATVVLCNEKGKVKETIELDYYGVDVDYRDRRIAVLGNMRCEVFDHSGKSVWESGTDTANEIFLFNKSAVVVVSDTDCVYNGIN